MSSFFQAVLRAPRGQNGCRTCVHTLKGQPIGVPLTRTELQQVEPVPNSTAILGFQDSLSEKTVYFHHTSYVMLPHQTRRDLVPGPPSPSPTGKESSYSP
ncbi:hypothetical protein PGTUg99_000139 [Puccinia graminis f. sp. tritici]|uniref:Uncharacterized protein n=1 Tax=Puccinia graminis f. sp. tritici TaxID=56615 RepID=A0A5B0LHZ6_PUCGR|nr:hypothetical protein PGTUg99_000139 [Puccinia graminis f. sp. tritici]